MDQIRTQMFAIGNENLSMKYFRQAAWYVSRKKGGSGVVWGNALVLLILCGLPIELVMEFRPDIISTFGDIGRIIYLMILIFLNIYSLGMVAASITIILEKAKNPDSKFGMIKCFSWKLAGKIFITEIILSIIMGVIGISSFYLNMLLLDFFDNFILNILIYIISSIPGIIIGFRLFFSFIILVDQNLSPRNAIKRSWNITKGHYWNFLWFNIYFGFFNIIGCLCLFIGMIRTIPMQQIALMYYYYQISQLYDKNINPQQVTQTQNISSFSPTQTLQPSFESPSEKKGSGKLIIFLLIIAIIGGGYLFLKDKIDLSNITNKIFSTTRYEDGLYSIYSKFTINGETAYELVRSKKYSSVEKIHEQAIKIKGNEYPWLDLYDDFGEFIDLNLTFSGNVIHTWNFIDSPTQKDLGQPTQEELEKMYLFEKMYPIKKTSFQNNFSLSKFQTDTIYEYTVTPNDAILPLFNNDTQEDIILFQKEKESFQKKFKPTLISSKPQNKDKSATMHFSTEDQNYYFLLKKATPTNIKQYLYKDITFLSEYEIGKEYTEMSEDYFFNDTEKALKLKIEEKTVTLTPNEIYIKDTFDRDFTILGEDTQKQISSKDKNSKKTEKSEGESKKKKSNNNNYYIIDNNDKDYPQGCNTVGLKDPSNLCILSLYADNSRNSRGNQKSGTLYVSPAKFESLQNGDDAYTYCEKLDLGGVVWEVPLSHEGAWSDIVKIQDKIYNLTAEGSEKTNHYRADNRSGDVASRHNCRLDGACGSAGSKSKLSVRCVTRDKPHFN